MTIRPFIGWAFDGGAVLPIADGGALGQPAWGPAGLLRDLELRLGLCPVEEVTALRVADWAARLDELVPLDPFYAASLRVDRLGTAEMLLAWRDELVDAGWDGERIPDGGPRLGTFATLEGLAELPLAPGTSDRLAAVEAQLELAQRSPYAALTLCDEPLAWPARWRRVCALLEAGGTRARRLGADPPGAPARSDLGRLQALLRAGHTIDEPLRLERDGSLVLLEAATTLDAAQSVAAIIAARRDGSTAIVRGGADALLDEGLAAAGLPTLGAPSRSRWRPALQLLPLALRLMFRPPDVAAALELLGLACGPFLPTTRYMLGRALGDVPGIGGPRWIAAKERLRERLRRSDDGDAADAASADDELARVELWLERTPAAAGDTAAVADVRAAVARVAACLRDRLGPEIEPGVIAALAQCAQLDALLERDRRDRFRALDLNQLLDAVGVEVAEPLHVERCGRPDHVDHAGALLGSRDLVVWWHFVAAAAHTPHRTRWRRSELTALARAGVDLVTQGARLDADSVQWRRAVLAASERMIFVVPRWDRGEALSPHPLWAEIVGQMRLTTEEVARATYTTAALLDRPCWGVETERLPAAVLPQPRPAWDLPAAAIQWAESWPPTVVSALLECPLRGLLEQTPGLRSSGVPALAHGPWLNGVLGHQLVQRLFELGALDASSEVCLEVLDEMLPGIAAPLLQPGMGNELAQLRDQLAGAVAALARLLARGEMSVVSVEESLTGSLDGQTLNGRIDLRLRDTAGSEAIVDLKWGGSTYRGLLKSGRAVQLAIYSHLTRGEVGPAPGSAYFSLSRGTLMTTEPERFGGEGGIDGPSAAETMARIRRTLPLVRQAVSRGEVAVTGVRGSRPLLDTLGVAQHEHASHYRADPGAGCDFCRHAALCGRAWETLR